MIGKITTIVLFKRGVKMINFDINGIKCRTYVDEKNANSKRWEKVKIGDFIDGLDWFDEKGKIIDADSTVSVLK